MTHTYTTAAVLFLVHTKKTKYDTVPIMRPLSSYCFCHTVAFNGVQDSPVKGHTTIWLIPTQQQQWSL
jgi:hypothetical protein